MEQQQIVDSLNIIITDMQILAQALVDALTDDPATGADESKIGLRESIEIGKIAWELAQDIMAVFTTNRAHLPEYLEALQHAHLVIDWPVDPQTMPEASLGKLPDPPGA